MHNVLLSALAAELSDFSKRVATLQELPVFGEMMCGLEESQLLSSMIGLQDLDRLGQDCAALSELVLASATSDGPVTDLLSDMPLQSLADRLRAHIADGEVGCPGE